MDIANWSSMRTDAEQPIGSVSYPDGGAEGVRRELRPAGPILNGDIEREINHGVQVDLTAVALRNNLPSIFVSLVSAIGFSFVAWSSETWIGLWLAAIAAAAGARLVIQAWSVRSLRESWGSDPARFRAIRLGHAVGLFAAAMPWVVLAWFELPDMAMRERHVFLIIVSSLAGGAMGVLASRLVVGRIYIAMMLLPSCIRLVMLDEPEYVLSALGILFFGTMYVGISANHRALVRSFRLARENQQLFVRVRRHADEVEKINTSLERRVEERTQKLADMVDHDILTGLLNRRGIRRRLDAIVAADASARFAVLFLDLDRFKSVNDTLGHEVGDIVLRKIANRFAMLSPKDAAIARWGGDEFLVMLPDGENFDRRIEEIAADLRDVAQAPLEVEGRVLGLGASIGIAVHPEDGLGVTQAIHAADLAGTEAKRTGRSKFLRFDANVAERQRRRQEIGFELRQANYDECFEVYYQPIVDAKTGAVHQREALVRWTHGNLGVVSPAEFIPIAEETGHIVDLGQWVLVRACRDAVAWQAAGAPVGVAVNVSIRQILSEGWVDQVLMTLETTGLPTELLEIEVTESAFDEECGPVVIEGLRRLSEHGVRIVVDDFGTGYSALSRLRQLPIDGVKIDRSFVVSQDERDFAIIEATIFIARRYGLSVTAEGIETQEQIQRLRGVGIDHFQGYYYGRPERLSAIAFEAPSRKRVASGTTGA